MSNTGESRLSRWIDDSIADSIRDDRIVHLRPASAAGRAKLIEALSCRADDYVLCDNTDSEFWGSDEDGDAWRVHVDAPYSAVHP